MNVVYEVPVRDPTAICRRTLNIKVCGTQNELEIDMQV